ncbi:putative ferric-chelate reductase 1 isoform X2 [Ambystoma mexicanum]|uniref:putative ferric-chelate reductase 1 isoform X2 n=1 Tax=Ambystoma mexicanum TaxID=8296 RepID=UPI0037E9C158
MDRFTLLLLGISSFLILRVHCYPNGKVNVACESMMPNHRADPQTSQAPYSISVSNTVFSPGDKITVTLQANVGSTFKGFLLQAQTVGGNAIVGSFDVSDSSAQTLQCNNMVNSAVSHTSATSKTRISVVWTAPSGSSQTLFRATFVQSAPIFWTQVESQALLQSQISNDTCGTEKFCLSNSTGCSPADASCFFMSVAQLSRGGYTLEMSGASDGYVAIGFSDDKIMGNDDIYICVLNAGKIYIERGSSTIQKTVNQNGLVSLQSNATSFQNGVIKCSFTIENNIRTPDGNSNSSYYVFLARGSAPNGIIQKHNQIPLISSKKVDLSPVSQEQLSPSSSAFSTSAKVHGALMLIAWMTTGSIGMLFARYLKGSAKSLVFGKAVWFQVHQALMGLTVAATIIAFIIIFADSQGWKYGAGAHPHLGCIVMILSFFQPIIAFFRPDPKDSRRMYFNVFHAVNALVIKVLADPVSGWCDCGTKWTPFGRVKRHDAPDKKCHVCANDQWETDDEEQ